MSTVFAPAWRDDVRERLLDRAEDRDLHGGREAVLEALRSRARRDPGAASGCRATHQRTAETRPRSSSTDGRRSKMTRWSPSSVRDARARASSSFAPASSGVAARRTVSSPTASAATVWHVSSWSSRAILRRSSSCAERSFLTSSARRASRSRSSCVSLSSSARARGDAALERRVRARDLLERSREGDAHRLERAGEAVDLVVAVGARGRKRHGLREVAGREALGGVREDAERTAHAAGRAPGEESRDDDEEQASGTRTGP